MHTRLPVFQTLLLTLLLTSCSSIRLGYEFADEYIKYEISDRFDLDHAQEQLAYNEIDAFVAWHRTHELDKLIAIAHRVEQVTQDNTISNAQFDEIYNMLRETRARYYEKAVPMLVDLFATLSTEQVTTFNKSLDEDTEDWESELKDSEAERRQQRLKELKGTYEDWFGNLSDRQIEFIRSHIDVSDQAVEQWRARRITRNRFYYQTLKDHRTNKPYMTKLLNRYIVDPDFFQPADQKVYDQLYHKARMTIPAFFQLVSDDQLTEFHTNIHELIEDLNSLKE